METVDLDLVHVIVPAFSGLIGAVLTYLTMRKQSEVSEKTVYIDAVEKLTTGLREEIDRVNLDRSAMAEKILTLEKQADRYENTERTLKRRVAELEGRERLLLIRIEHLERERDRLRDGLQGYTNGSSGDDAG